MLNQAQFNAAIDYANRPLGPRKRRDQKFDGFGICIYCRRQVAPLREEHVVPRALGTYDAIRNASCTACEKITHAFEGKALNTFFLHSRLKMRLKKTNPQTIRVKDCSGNYIEINPDDHPIFAHYPMLGFSRALLEIAPCLIGKQFVRMEKLRNTDLTRAFSNNGYLEAALDTINVPLFCRMIAKIAYCAVIPYFGIDSFHPTVTKYITGKLDLGFDYFVGIDFSEIEEAIPAKHPRHRHGGGIIALRSGPALFGRVKLFLDTPYPTYNVYLGHLTDLGIRTYLK